MFRVLLVTKNRLLAEFCRQNIHALCAIKTVSKFDLKKHTGYAVVVFDSDYLLEASYPVLAAVAERFAAEDGGIAIGILANETNKMRALSLFPDRSEFIHGILQYRISEGKLAGLSAQDWRWFLKTQIRILKLSSERALARHENDLLAKRLANINAMPAAELRSPAFMHGKSAAIVNFRERLFEVLSKSPFIFLTSRGDLPIQDFLEYYARLLHPENPTPYRTVDLAKTARHLHAQALWPAKTIKAKRSIICVQNIAALNWQNQTRLFTQLKNSDATDRCFVLTADAEIARPVRNGMFRQDLYSYIKKASVELPALYERPEDLSCVAAEYIHSKGFSFLVEEKSDAARRLMQRFDISSGYSGLFMTLDLLHDLKKSNGLPIFELGNAGEGSEAWRAARTFLREENAPDPTSLFNTLAAGEKESLSLDAVEKQYIAAVCQKYGWQVSDAARHLKISRKTLYDKMRRFKIVRPEKGKKAS